MGTIDTEFLIITCGITHIVSLLDLLSDRVSIPPEASLRRWSRLAVVWFGSIGFIAPIALFVSMWIYNTFITRGALSMDGPPIVSTAVVLGVTSVSAGVIGGTVWHLLVERFGQRLLRTREVVVGAVTSVFAMPPVLFVEFLFFSTENYGIASALIVAVGFSVYGIFLVGWLTIPLGIVAGYSLGTIRLAA